MTDHRTQWDTRFGATDAYVFGTSPSQFLVHHAARLPSGSRLLLPADGEGRNSVYLAQLGHKVTALDISAAGQAKARLLAESAGVNVDFQLADLSGWNWPEAAYDAVVGIFFQFADPDFRTRIFDGMKKAVRPGGLMMVHGYTPKQLDYKTGGPSQIENLYTEGLLRDAFADCRIDHLKAYEAELDEGAGHKGMSALIDLIAVKP